MGDWIENLLPIFLVMARVTAFFAVLPLFGWPMLPMRVRLAIALLSTIFFASILPAPKLTANDVHWLGASLMITREILCGLAIGMIARLVFLGIQQGVLVGTQQMGFADAGIIDPSSGERAQPIGMIFQMVFAVLFLSAEGHHLLILAIDRSYDAFPIGTSPEMAAMTQGIIEAGCVMMLFALKIAAPLLAGFMILAVIMGILARVMPEMNILMASLPLRVFMGLFMALVVMETLNSFVAEVIGWIDEYMVLT